MVVCSSNEKDTKPDKIGAIVGTSVSSFVCLVFILFVIFLYHNKELNRSKAIAASTAAAKEAFTHNATIATDHAAYNAKMAALSSYDTAKIAIDAANEAFAALHKALTSNGIIGDGGGGGGGGVATAFGSPFNQLNPFKFTPSTTSIENFNVWLDRASKSINSGTILAILAAGVIIGFNSLIMTPVIVSMFPVSITQGFYIPGRNAYVYPGQFFIALIGFIICIILVFFIILVMDWANAFPFIKESKWIFLLIVLSSLLLALLVWNSYEAHNIFKQPDCVQPEIPTIPQSPLQLPQSQLTPMSQLFSSPIEHKPVEDLSLPQPQPQPQTQTVDQLNIPAYKPEFGMFG